jgi:predicted DNA-binding WGR domain protein
MSKNLNYVFIGHYKDDKANSDKCWGIIELVPPQYSYDAGSYIVFWGRRGSKYQTKVIAKATSYVIRDLYQSKLDKGYRQVKKSKLDEIYPNFEKDLETTAFWTVLTKSDDLGAKAFDYVKDKTDIMNE